MERPAGLKLSPSGNPWLVWQNVENGAAKGRALDASNRWWIYYGPADVRNGQIAVTDGGAVGFHMAPASSFLDGQSYHPTSPLMGFPLVYDRGHWFAPDTGSSDWISAASDWLGAVVTKTVAPAILAAITAANPAVGTIATVVYQQAMQVAQGKSMNAAFVDALRASVASQFGDFTLQQFDDGRALALKNDAVALQSALKGIASLGDPKLVDAFRTGSAAGVAEVVQSNAWDRLYEALRKKLPFDPGPAVDSARKAGGDLITVAVAYLGPQAGVAATKQALLAGARQAGVPENVATTAIASGGSGASVAASPSSDGSSWGLVGAFVAVGVGVWWWLRHR